MRNIAVARAWLGIALSALAMVLVVSIAAADPAEDKARELFKQGVTALQKGSFEEALGQFEGAYELWNNPKILLNIATTLRELGQLPEAAEAYEQYLLDPGADPSKTADVRNALGEIDAKLLRLRVVVVTSGANLTIDGAPLRVRRQPRTGRIARTLEEPTREHTVRVAPGEHTIAASLDGFEPWSQVVSGAGGDEKLLTIELAVAKPTAVVRPQEGERDPEPEGSLSHEGQWMLFTRADVDGKVRGAVVVVGGGRALSSVVELQLAALLGRDKGVEPGATFYFAKGMFKPLAFVGMPTFFVDGASPGGHLALGLQVDPSRSIGVLAQVGVAQFFNVPDDRESTAFVPSLGVQGRF